MATTQADLVAATDALTDAAQEFTTWNGVIRDRVDAAIQAIPDFLKKFTVDQATGDDANEGTELSPLASFQEAFRRTPVGGVCEIMLVNDYHFTEVETHAGICVRVTAQNTPKVTFSWLDDPGNPGQIERLATFRSEHVAQYEFLGVNFELPADPAGALTNGHLKGIFSSTFLLSPSYIGVKFMDCEFLDPTASTEAHVFGRWIGHISAGFQDCVFPANFEGRVAHTLGGVGIDPATLGHRIATNLTWL